MFPLRIFKTISGEQNEHYREFSKIEVRVLNGVSQ